MPTTAWFGSIDSMNVDTIRRLRDQMGLTAVIPDDYTPHHSGFRMPKELLDRSPLAQWQSQPTVDAHRKTHGLSPQASPVFPGIVGPIYDDGRLLRLIEDCDRLGVEVWAHLGLWGYGGDIFPDLALQDDRGQTIPQEYAYWGVPICPNNTEVRDWTAECLQHIVTHYGVKGLDVDHGHYPPPASISSLFGCCCHHCHERARAWGYDWEAMLAALADLRLRFGQLDRDEFERVAGLSYSFLDFLGRLGYSSDLLDWFRFRSQSVTEHMRALTEAVHEVAGHTCPVDSHLFPPAIAFLSGQDMPSWQTAVDRLTPGWGAVVGWIESQANSFAVWARTLCRELEGLEEPTALQVIYRFFGYDALPMPSSGAELEAGSVPRAEILALEIAKAASLFGDATPFLPPFPMYQLTSDDRLVVGEAVQSAGATGFVTTGNPDALSDPELGAMRLDL
jgi:hypothetical protein